VSATEIELAAAGAVTVGRQARTLAAEALTSSDTEAERTVAAAATASPRSGPSASARTLHRAAMDLSLPLASAVRISVASAAGA
jgi:hypothetical protein